MTRKLKGDFRVTAVKIHKILVILKVDSSTRCDKDEVAAVLTQSRLWPYAVQMRRCVECPLPALTGHSYRFSDIARLAPHSRQTTCRAHQPTATNHRCANNGAKYRPV